MSADVEEDILDLSKKYHIFYISNKEWQIKSILMFIHGLGEHGGRYVKWAKTLAENNNIGVLLIDLPGHGKLIQEDIKQGELFNIIDGYNDFRLIHNNYCKRYSWKILKIIGGFSLGGLMATDYITRQIDPETLHLLAIAPAYMTYSNLSIYNSLKTLWWALTLPRKVLTVPINTRKLVKSKKILTEFYNDKLSHGLCTAYISIYAFLTGLWITYNAKFPNNSNICILHGNKDAIVSHFASIDLADRIHANNIRVSMNIIPNGYHHLLGDEDNSITIKIIDNWIKNLLS